MDLVKALFPCFPASSIHLDTDKPTHYHNPSTSTIASTPNEKAPIHILTAEEAAKKIVGALLTADAVGPALDARIQSFAHQAGGWSESLARCVLSGLEAVLKAGEAVGAAMPAAYDKACEAAKVFEEFVAEHPLATAAFCTVIALGILVFMAPWVLEALGFGAFGPVEGEPDATMLREGTC